MQRRYDSSIGRQIVDGYTRIPPAVPDQWGDLAAMADQASVDLLRRLDAEERRCARRSGTRPPANRRR